MKYKKSQIGWIIISLLLTAIIFLSLAYTNQWGNRPLPLTPYILLTLLFAGICALFYQLTVEVNGSTLKLIYGIGLIRIKFTIDKLEEIKIIKTPWYYGLGIRITPDGMLYNIQGTKAVNISYTRNKKKKSVMIGTTEPEKLMRVLEDNWKIK